MKHVQGPNSARPHTPCAYGGKLANGKVASFGITLISTFISNAKQKYITSFSDIPTLELQPLHTEFSHSLSISIFHILQFLLKLPKSPSIPSLFHHLTIIESCFEAPFTHCSSLLVFCFSKHTSMANCDWSIFKPC